VVEDAVVVVDLISLAKGNDRLFLLGRGCLGRGATIGKEG